MPIIILVYSFELVTKTIRPRPFHSVSFQPVTLPFVSTGAINCLSLTRYLLRNVLHLLKSHLSPVSTTRVDGPS